MRITIGCLMLGIAVIACLLGAAAYFGDGVAFVIVYGLAALAMPVAAYAIWIGLIVGLIQIKRREIEHDRRRGKLGLIRSDRWRERRMDDEAWEQVFRGDWVRPVLWGLAGFVTPILVVGLSAYFCFSLLWLIGPSESEPGAFLLAIVGAGLPLYVAWIGLIIYLVVRRRRGHSKPAKVRWEE